MEQSESKDEVETELLNVLQLLNDAMDVMEHLEEENKPALISIVQEIVKSFKHLHELEPSIKGSVPLELIEQIDKGNNPDDYSKKLVEECRQSAKRVEEKQKRMQSLKDNLDFLISTMFPQEL